jgi:hypothetical protein
LSAVKLLMALTLAITALGLAACGDDDDDGSGTTAGGGIETTAEGGGEPILIKTHVAALEGPADATTGEVLSGSTIGDSAFCRGGTFRDAAVEPGTDEIMRLFRCSDGEVTISFTSTPPDVPQRSDWEVVRGGGAFEGFSGGGRMKAVSESSTGEARETFTGTVTR